jgi:hypothetical protein
MANEYKKKLEKKEEEEEKSTSLSSIETESVRSSEGVFADSSPADHDFKTIMSRIVGLTKKETGVDIRFFPSSVAKLWVVLSYVETPQDRLSLLKNQLVRDDLKLKSVDEEKLAKLSLFYNEKDERWLDLNKEGFERLMEDFLECPSFSSVDTNFLMFQNILRSSEFFKDFENDFVRRSGIFVSNVPKVTGETTHSSACDSEEIRSESKSEETKFCRSWEKLVFLLKLYKTPIGSLDDVSLWKGVYNRKFVEAKTTLLTKHPELPISVVFLIIHFMNEKSS